MIAASIMIPQDRISPVLTLMMERRGVQTDLVYLDDGRVLLKYDGLRCVCVALHQWLCSGAPTFLCVCLCVVCTAPGTMFPGRRSSPISSRRSSSCLLVRGLGSVSEGRCCVCCAGVAGIRVSATSHPSPCPFGTASSPPYLADVLGTTNTRRDAGYATFDYEPLGMQQADIVKVCSSCFYCRLWLCVVWLAWFAL